MFKIGDKVKAQFAGEILDGLVSEFDDKRIGVTFDFGTTKFFSPEEIFPEAPASTKFEKAIKQLMKAEHAARKAQAALDAASIRFNKAMEIVRPQGKGYSKEWKEYCDANGLAYNYDFGDTIC